MNMSEKLKGTINELLRLGREDPEFLVNSINKELADETAGSAATVGKAFYYILAKLCPKLRHAYNDSKELNDAVSKIGTYFRAFERYDEAVEFARQQGMDLQEARVVLEQVAKIAQGKALAPKQAKVNTI